MEVTVWTEGRSRVVGGITDTTTCQDLVHALATATGKTGRFTLLERWRNNDYVIGPEECIVAVQQKWGEYVGEVQFVLKHNFNPPPSVSSSISSVGQESGYSLDSRHGGSRSSLKKSLTFSGGRKSHVSISSGMCRSPLQPQLEVEDLSSGRTHSPAAVSPYGSLEHRRRRRNAPSYSSQSSTDSHWKPQRPSPSPRTNQVPPPHSGSPRYLSPRAVTESPHSSSMDKQQQTSPIKIHPFRSQNGQLAGSASATQFRVLTNGKDTHDTHHTSPVPAVGKIQTSKGGVCRQELLHLIALQRQRLAGQQQQLNGLTAEVAVHEKCVDDHNARSSAMAEEIEMLEQKEEKILGELQDLEIVSWVDKRDREIQKQRVLKNEMAALQAKVKACDAERKDCDAKYRDTESQLTEEEKTAEKEKQKREEEEKKLLAQEQEILTEIEEIKRQIERSSSRHQEGVTSLEEMEREIYLLDEDVQKRKEEVERLEKELRQANIRHLGRSVEELRNSREGFRRPSPTRPGSARRLNSPQRLRDAVSTIKDPHGLWV